MRLLRTSRVALAFATFAFVARAHAESASLPSPLTPDAVVAYAAAHRPEIDAAKAKAKAAAAAPKVVSGLPDPMIMGSIDHFPFTMLGEKGINWSVMIQQDFPLSGELGAKRRAAEADALGANAETFRAQLDVETQALDAFVMRAEVDRMTALVEEQIAFAKDVLVATEARLAVAEAQAADVVRAQTDVVLFEGERKALEGERIGADAMLDASLGRPADAAVPSPALTVPTNAPSPTPQLVALALEHRPELASMRANVASAEAKVDVMDSMYTPMAFVRIGTARTMEMGQGGMLMVGLTIPLWREKLDSGVDEAKSMLVMAEDDVSAMKNMIQGDVGSARGMVIAARARYASVHDEVVPLARKTVTLMLASYAGGQSSLVAVLDAVRALREARMQEIVAEIELARAWIRLGRAVGVVRIGSF
jgi:outer membrane protein TolC